MKDIILRISLSFLLLIIPKGCLHSMDSSGEKVRLVILADMGNEPDEEQQMMHMLMYSNEFDLEGLISVSGFAIHSERLRKDGTYGKVHPELFLQLIDGYSEVVDNLKHHAKGWPDPAYLKSIVKQGTSVFGIKGIGPGKETSGSKFLMEILENDDPRPLYIVVNAGSNTLAQALMDLDEIRSDEEMESICRKVILFDNGAQDDAGVWIMLRYPEINWYRSLTQTYAYGGPGTNPPWGPYTWEPYVRSTKGQHEWAAEHIMNNHGALGKLYPYRWKYPGNSNIEGGGTIPWIGLSKPDLWDPEHMHWGGWGGRFSRIRYSNKEVLPNNTQIWSPKVTTMASEKAQAEGKTFSMFLADTETENWRDSIHCEDFSGCMVPVWRWRRAMYNDFRARMDWCVQPFEQANHNPVAAINGDASNTIIKLEVDPGDAIDLDCSATTDPDGDKMLFKWWIYKEAGTYGGDVSIDLPEEHKARVQIPEDAGGKQIHVILEVVDTNKEVALYDYRRVVIDVY